MYSGGKGCMYCFDTNKLHAILSETPGHVSAAFRSLQEFTQDISKAKL